MGAPSRRGFPVIPVAAGIVAIAPAAGGYLWWPGKASPGKGAVHFIPATRWREMVFGYLALQSALSYCIAGWVKAVNPEWRNEQALQAELAAPDQTG